MTDIRERQLDMPLDDCAAQPDAGRADAGRSVTPEPIVELDHVSMRLGGRLIWSGATTTIAEGEFIVVLGPNGAGKSTLLRLLLGLTQPSEGRITVFGETPRRGNPQIGYVPQRRTADTGLGVRGRDLVALGIDGHLWGTGLPGERRKRQRIQVDEAIAAVGASAYADRAVGQLSGGERQRLLLAQALVSQPRLLLLDEPLANLDIRSQLTTAQVVGQLARQQGITVVLVAHDVNPLLSALDRVLYIAHGGIAIGAPEEVITSERLSTLYDAPIEVVRDSRGRVFVVGMDEETTHPEAVQEHKG